MENTTTQITSLYERLGGEVEIKKIVDDAIEAHMHNPGIRARFLPYLETPEDLDNAKRHLVAFFSSGSGGPQVYEGRELPTAHRGMNINSSEYMCAIDDIMMTLDKYGKDEQTKKDVLLILYSLKEQIIGH
jgi:hemoglobin